MFQKKLPPNAHCCPCPFPIVAKSNCGWLEIKFRSHILIKIKLNSPYNKILPHFDTQSVEDTPVQLFTTPLPTAVLIRYWGVTRVMHIIYVLIRKTVDHNRSNTQKNGWWITDSMMSLAMCGWIDIDSHSMSRTALNTVLWVLLDNNRVVVLSM